MTFSATMNPAFPLDDLLPMILDTSALLAILLDEPERPAFVRCIESEPIRRASAASILEASMVLEARFGSAAEGALDLFLHRAGVEIIAFDQDQLAIARSAFRRYGKGRHPACLNFGDCITYALARFMDEPLLFKGTDFPSTDITPAVS
jgi:ribonuclease VapC